MKTVSMDQRMACKSFDWSLIAVVLASGLSFIGPAVSQVPQQVSVQGVLLSNAGQPVANGTYSLRLEIYDASESGNLLWGPQTLSNVNVSSGRFATRLGPTDDQAAPLSAALEDSERFLSVAFSLDGVNFETVGTRQQLLSVPFALSSSSVGNDAVNSSSIVDGSISASDVDTNELQTRILNACSNGSSIQSIDSTGNAVCAADDDTLGELDCLDGQVARFDNAMGSWTCADALSSGSVDSAAIQDNSVGGVDVDGTEVQLRVSSSCEVGMAIRQINEDGTVECEAASSSAGTKLRQSSTTTIAAGAWRKVTLNVEVYDEGGWHNGNSRVTVPSSGIYLIVGNCAYTGGPYDEIGVAVSVNGQRLAKSLIDVSSNSGGNSEGLSVSAIESLSAGDFIELETFINTTTAFTDAGGTSLSVERLR